MRGLGETVSFHAEVSGMGKCIKTQNMACSQRRFSFTDMSAKACMGILGLGYKKQSPRQ